MKVLVTGGAGFIGRWIVKRLLDDGVDVWVLDNLSNGSKKNLAEFSGFSTYRGLTTGDVAEPSCLETLFAQNFHVCIHAAARINVQESLLHPEKYFTDNISGTFNILECARKYGARLVLVGTCMVYDAASADYKLSENSPVKPSSPYAASKLAAEYLGLSYYYSYGLPVTLLRPFNTFGPFQKTNMEGGVVSIFIKNHLSGDKLKVFGNGKQTRDLLYVEDCADFIVRAALVEKAVGRTINAGTGKDISINDLAILVCRDSKKIEHVEHHHPQSEIQKLQCDSSLAKELLGWEPVTSLEQGIRKTRQWIESLEVK